MSERKTIYVRDVMDSSVLLVDGLATIKEVLELLKGSENTAVMIKKRHADDEFGICLLSDIARKVLAKDRSPERVNAYEIMSKPVISVRPDMDVRYCARLLEATDLACAPVIEGNTILGMVGYRELVLHGLLELYS